VVTAAPVSLELCAGSGTEIVVFLDGDGSDYPEFMKQLVINRGRHAWFVSVRAHAINANRQHEFSANCGSTGRMADVDFSGVRYRHAHSREWRDASDIIDERRNYGWNLEMQMKAARRVCNSSPGQSSTTPGGVQSFRHIARNVRRGRTNRCDICAHRYEKKPR
jgi:hypothetical protein